MSTEIPRFGYVMLGAAVLLTVLIAGCTSAPAGAPQTPVATATTTPPQIPSVPPTIMTTTSPLPAASPLAGSPAATITISMATPAPTPASGSVMAIAIKNYGLNPTIVTIPAGTTVTWTNFDITPHQISSSATSTAGPGKIFLSQVLQKNGNYSFTFNTTGTYLYFFVDNPNTIGNITVT